MARLSDQRSWPWALLLGACALHTPMAAQAQPCDSLHTISVAMYPQIGLTAQIVIGVDSQSTATWFADMPQWAVVIDGQLYSGSAVQPYIEFPHPGTYLICGEATLTDGQQNYCMATVCDTFVVEPYWPGCLGDTLHPNFTIMPQGQDVAFFDQSVHNVPVDEYQWNFGDGTPVLHGPLSQIVHTYAGTGPYNVCMSIRADSCWATQCNWIYFGPSDVPCEQLLLTDVRHAEIGLTTALYDASITSGMNYDVHWTLGDGTVANGRAVFHTYADSGFYTVTAVGLLTGPLAASPCTNYTTFDVYVPGGVVVAGVETLEATPTLQAFPVPFTDMVTIEGTALKRGDRWQVLDAAGRLCLHDAAPRDGTITIDGTALPTGVYVLRVFGKAPSVLRLVKQ